MSEPLTADQIKANSSEFAKSVQPNLAAAGIAKIVIEITKNGISVATTGEKPPKPTPQPT